MKKKKVTKNKNDNIKNLSKFNNLLKKSLGLKTKQKSV